MAHTNIHDPLHVYSNRELPLTQLPVDNNIDTLQRRHFVGVEGNRRFYDLSVCFSFRETKCRSKGIGQILQNTSWKTARIFELEQGYRLICTAVCMESTCC